MLNTKIRKQDKIIVNNVVNRNKIRYIFSQKKIRPKNLIVISKNYRSSLDETDNIVSHYTIRKVDTISEPFEILDKLRYEITGEIEVILVPIFEYSDDLEEEIEIAKRDLDDIDNDIKILGKKSFKDLKENSILSFYNDLSDFAKKQDLRTALLIDQRSKFERVRELEDYKKVLELIKENE